MIHDDLGVARIRIQGDWDLEMISAVSHAYVEVYSAGCFLLGPIASPPPQGPDTPDTGRYSYPWRGGYSALNFFRSIYVHLPLRYRPEVLEIAYASPGFIEILGYTAAFTLVIRTVTVNATRILGVYKDVQDVIAKQELNKLDARQRRAHTRFIETLYNRLAEAMDLPAEATDKLKASTHADVWARLKILLALARRIEKVAEFGRADVASLEEARTVTAVLAEPQSQEKTRKIMDKIHSELPTRLIQQPPIVVRSGSGNTDDNE